MWCCYFQIQRTNCLWHKYCNIQLFSGAISNGVSDEPEMYLQPSQTSKGSVFAKIVNGYKPLIMDVQDGSKCASVNTNLH